MFDPVFSLSRDAVSPMKLGWMFGFGYFLVTLNWIVEPFLVDLQTTGFMAPFALILMAGLALFWGAAGGLRVALGRLVGSWA